MTIYERKMRFNSQQPLYLALGQLSSGKIWNKTWLFRCNGNSIIFGYIYLIPLLLKGEKNITAKFIIVHHQPSKFYFRAGANFRSRGFNIGRSDFFGGGASITGKLFSRSLRRRAIRSVDGAISQETYYKHVFGVLKKWEIDGMVIASEYNL